MPARSSRSAEYSLVKHREISPSVPWLDDPRESGGEREPAVRGTRQYALICSVHAKGLPYKSPFPKEAHQKGLLQKENARAICTRNSKQVMKIGPRERRFTAFLGDRFLCIIFCKDICNSLLFLFHANSYGLMVFVSHGFPTGRLFLFHAVFPQADRFFHTIFLQNDSSSTRFPRNDPSCFAQLSRRPPRFWRQTSSSLSKRPERTAWGRPSRPRCTVPVPARVGA